MKRGLRMRRKEAGGKLKDRKVKEKEKIKLFWGVKPCSEVKISQTFRRDTLPQVS
jgi:hypothetical protein